MTDFKSGDRALVMCVFTDGHSITPISGAQVTPVPSVEDVVVAMYGDERFNWSFEMREVANMQAREVLALFGVGA